MTPRAAVAALLAATGLSGCVEDGCAFFPSDPRCLLLDDIPRITVLTRRLSQRGGSIIVHVSDFTTGDIVFLTLGDGGPRLDCIMMPDGNGTATVPADKLAATPTGPLNISLFAGQSRLSATLRIFSPAVFDDATRATVSFADRQPSYVQIRQQHLFATLDTEMERRIDEYEYQQSGAILTPLTARDALLGAGMPTYLLDVSETQIFKLLPSGGLVYAPLDTTTYNTLRTLALSELGALSVDRAGQVIAVAGSGPDGPLKALTVPAASELSIVNLVSKRVVGLGWGIINTDNLLDLVARHDDNSFAVYLRRDDTTLAYDAATSAALNAAAGSAQITRFSVADIDSDGLDDVIAAQGTQLTQLVNEGDAMWSREPLKSDRAADAIAIADLTGDGRPELALAQRNPATLTVYPNLPL